MKRQKRNKVDRAFAKGLVAGSRGHTEQNCPYTAPSTKGAWFGGWRAGRHQYLCGYIGASYD